MRHSRSSDGCRSRRSGDSVATTGYDRSLNAPNGNRGGVLDFLRSPGVLWQHGSIIRGPWVFIVRHNLSAPFIGPLSITSPRHV